VRKLCIWLTLAVMIVFATSASATAQAARGRARGTLIVVVTGLPSGTAARGTITGPGGLHRRFSSIGSFRLQGAQPGHYEIGLARVTITKPDGIIRAGAIATPTAAHTTLQIKAAKTTRERLVYGTIVNPNVSKLSATPTRVIGEPDHPTGLVLKGRAPRVGSYLTSGSTTTLPVGLVAKVTAVKVKGTVVTLSLTPAAISEVAPVVNYAGAIGFHETPSASAASAPPCGVGSDLALTGGMKITEIGLNGLEGSIWPSPRLAFQTTIGIAGEAGWSSAASASCEAADTLATWTGVIPGLEIPVFAQPKLALTGSVTAATTNGFDAKTTLVTKFDSRPASVSLGLTGSSASLTGNHSGISAEVSLGLYLEVGIGVPDIDSLPIALNIHATLGSALAFTADPSNPTPDERCRVHAKLGSLEIGLTGGPFSLSLAAFSGLDQRISAFNCGLPSAGAPGSGGGGGGGGTGPGGGGGGGAAGVTGLVTNISIGQIENGGEDATCAVLTNGTVDCWGENANEALGTGSSAAYSAIPQPVLGISTATQVTVGRETTCALLASGTIDCWRQDVGDGVGSVPSSSHTPVAVPGISHAINVSAGDSHDCAVTGEGEVECWGANPNGELGNGTEGNYNFSPTHVQNITNAIAISAGGYQTCALLRTGEVDCWGYNPYGDLGNGSYATSDVPVSVSGITDAVEISASSNDHTCAVLVTGEVKCWGANVWGELGNGQGGFEENSPIPVLVTGISDAKAVSAGDGDACALLATGSVDCWGDNLGGQLGDGTETESDTPAPVTASANTIAVTASDSTCALVRKEAVKCWGPNNDGELGNGSTTPSLTPTAVVGLEAAE
jgi:alpha-tubulin suppressor-like RCC1 family protein